MRLMTILKQIEIEMTVSLVMLSIFLKHKVGIFLQKQLDWSTAADSVSFKKAKFHTECSSLSKIKVGPLFSITRCSILLLWMNTYPAPPRFICLALLSWESASLMSSLAPLLLAKLDFKKSSIYESVWTGNFETSKLGSAVK